MNKKNNDITFRGFIMQLLGYNKETSLYQFWIDLAIENTRTQTRRRNPWDQYM